MQIKEHVFIHVCIYTYTYTKTMNSTQYICAQFLDNIGLIWAGNKGQIWKGKQ